MIADSFTTIVGLEVHVQLLTRSKLFCGCSTLYGSAPNTQTCPVCTGMPGSLPVLNEHALRLAIKTGLALNCKIASLTKWDRKNYFYPDLPKGYQISQFDKPICGEGFLHISDPKGKFKPGTVRIERAHLEEDAGKSLHDEENGQGDSKIDLNRTGTPLLEVVTQPDLRSGVEAKAFLTELKLILLYLGVSDCNMQQGSLRVDANVNLHIELEGERQATPIVEVKNLNSFRSVERALNYESQRQYAAWKENGITIHDAPKQTRGWDDQSQKTVPQREKEESADYRYFPDPDLVAIDVPTAEIRSIEAELGDLPAAIRKRIETQYEIPAYAADVIVNQGREVVEYFEIVAQGCGDGKLAGNWVTQEVLRHLNENEVSIKQFPIPGEWLVELLEMIKSSQLSTSRAKEVFAVMISSKTKAADAVRAVGIEHVNEEETQAICQQLIVENRTVIEQYKAGNHKAIGALIGKAKQLNPNINPNTIRKKIVEIIDNSG